MPTSRQTGRSAHHPTHVCTSSSGVAYLVNGIDAPRRWNGETASLDEFGIAAPSAAPSVSSSGSGTIDGAYVAYVRFIDADGVPSNLSPVATFTATTDATVSWSSIPVSTNSRVVARQLFRSTAGQSTTVYLAKTLNDNSTASTTETNTDAQLQASTALPILTSDGGVFANRFTPPSDLYSTMVDHRGRLYAAGVVDYSTGMAEVTNASTAVTGVGTAWTASMAGREFSVAGVGSFAIASVASGTSLTLSSNYTGSTSKFATYTIAAPPAYRNAIAYTYQGEDESWPATYLVTVPEDGDRITGLVEASSFLYVLKANSIRRFTVQNDPAVDGATYKTASRGCVNQRCCVLVEGSAYMLDRQGVHVFDGGSASPISTPIQRYFRGGVINWNAARWFHGCYSPEEEVVRFFVALDGRRYPRTALCFQIRDRRWWREDHSRPIASSGEAELEARPRAVYGTDAATVLLPEGTLDVPAAGDSTLRGTVASASHLRVEVSGAAFTSGVVNAPLAIVSGTGKGQWRRIVAASGDELTVDSPWLITPDATSVVQVGGFPWRWKTGKVTYPTIEQQNVRAVRVLARPTEEDATIDVSIYPNFETEPKTWGPMRQDNAEGVTIEAEADHAVIDVRRRRDGARADSSGNYGVRFDGGTDAWEPTERQVAIRLRGHASADRIKIHAVGVDGASQ